MIVEPVPTAPRSPIRRAAGWLGLVVPVALLVAVVSLGLLGRGAEPPSTVSSPRATSPGADPAAGGGGDAGGDAAGTGAAGAAPGSTDRAGLAFPTVSADLAVLAIPDAQAARTGGAADRPIAVAGYLGVVHAADGCADPLLGQLGPLCERRSILTERPSPPSAGLTIGASGPHLHLRIPVGVRLPDDTLASLAQGTPMPVVLVGRADTPTDPCPPTTSRCDDFLVVDRVTWADGADFAERPVIDAGLDGNPAEWMLRNRASAEVGAIGWSGTILVSALVRPLTVARIDPEAGEALRSAQSPAGLVWYVRGLESGYDPEKYPLGQAPPRLTWLVLDDVTGEVLARGGGLAPSTP